MLVDPEPALVAAVLALGWVPQFSGDETPEFCAAVAPERAIKAIHVEAGAAFSSGDAEAAAERYPQAELLFDSRARGLYGGTGTTFDWPPLAALARRRRVIVGGGLEPGNVASAVTGVRPFAVDVRSGVERDGAKDPVKMRAFVRAVRESDEGTQLAQT